MEKPSTWLVDFKSDIYSQTGEDGIIQEILKNIPNNDKWCVELGAWDGQFNSNTRNLIENYCYSAILIEGDKSRYSDLQKTYQQNKNVITVNQFVSYADQNSLDQLLKATPIPSDFDFLSIDIDGNDYFVWKGLSKYNPKVICIEFNPTIPTEISFVQPADPSINQGASLRSLVNLGKVKGYELVSVLPFNAFFVRSEYYQSFKIADNAPEVLRTCLDYVTYVFSGYDGKIFLRGNMELPWHFLKLRESNFQVLPWFLHKYPDNYTMIEKAIYGAYLIFSNPLVFMRKLRKRIRG